MRSFLGVWLAATVLGGAATAPAHAASIDLGWDAVAGAGGYRVYVGTSPGQYDTTIDVGPTTTTSLSDLDDCATYYVAVKAYNQAGESQSFSNEIAGWGRPELTQSAATAVQGEQLVLDIDGANFESGAELTIDTSSIPTDVVGNPLLVFGPIAVLSCHHAEALVAIEPGSAALQPMPLGVVSLPVQVVNPDGVFRNGSLALEVLFDEARADVNRSNARTLDRVDGDDLATLVRSWASGWGDSEFEWAVDLDGDTDVDGEDLALLALIFGRCRAGESWTTEACLDRAGT